MYWFSSARIRSQKDTPRPDRLSFLVADISRLMSSPLSAQILYIATFAGFEAKNSRFHFVLPTQYSIFPTACSKFNILWYASTSAADSFKYGSPLSSRASFRSASWSIKRIQISPNGWYTRILGLVAYILCSASFSASWTFPSNKHSLIFSRYLPASGLTRFENPPDHTESSFTCIRSFATFPNTIAPRNPFPIGNAWFHSSASFRK